MVLRFTPLSETAPVTAERPERRQETPPPRRPVGLTPVEERQLQAEAGNIEFNAELVNSGSQDAISRLGYTDETGLANYGKVRRAFYVEDNAHNRRIAESGAVLQFPIDSVNVGTGYATPDVWNHEFRHRGFRIVQNELTPEEQISIIGPEAYRALNDAFGAGGVPGSEAIVEVFDNPEASSGMVKGPDGKWVSRPMSETIQAMDSLSEEQQASIINSMNALAEVVLTRRRGKRISFTPVGSG